MSQDIIDLLKVLAVTFVVFAGSTLVMLYAILLIAQYGGNLPMVGSVPLTAPPEMIPLLAESRVFSTLAATHVTASGIALLMSSQTIDSGLLIVAKAVCVVVTALIGFAAGHMIYLQLAENAALFLSPLTPAVITLAGYLALSSVFSLGNLRRLGNLRFVVAAGLIVLGPLLLVWL